MYKCRWSRSEGLLILVSIMLFTPNVSHAAEWSVLENVSLGGIVTDNVDLVEEGKESKLIGVVTPSILMRGIGRRSRLDFAGSLIFNTNDDNPILPRYRLFSGTELVKNNFFFDAIAKAGQGRIDPFRPAGSPVVNQTGNITTVYEFTLNPYFVSRLNGNADLRVDYRYSDFLFSDDDTNPRRKKTLRMNLFTDPRSSKVSWGFDASTRKSEYKYDTNEDSRRSFADAVLRYQFNRKWRVAGSIGTESNTYESDTRDDTNTPRWYVEAQWTPNVRNRVTVRQGDRFFGPYTDLSMYHRSRKSLFRLEYKTKLRDSSDNLSDQNVLPDASLSGQPTNPFTNGPFQQPNDFVDLSNNGLYVEERFNAFYTLTGKKTVFDLVGQYSYRDYQDSSRETLFTRAYAEIQRGLNRKYSVRTRLDWQSTKDKSTDDTSDRIRFLVGLSRPVGSKSGLNLTYSYADRESNRPGDSFTENRLALFINTNYQGIPGYGFRF